MERLRAQASAEEIGRDLWRILGEPDGVWHIDGIVDEVRRRLTAPAVPSPAPKSPPPTFGSVRALLMFQLAALDESERLFATACGGAA